MTYRLKIDKHYDNWQFELGALENKIISFQSYRYIEKKLNYFLNFYTYKTELLFNVDYNKEFKTLLYCNTSKIPGTKLFKEVIIDEYTRKFKL